MGLDPLTAPDPTCSVVGDEAGLEQAEETLDELERHYGPTYAERLYR